MVASPEHCMLLASLPPLGGGMTSPAGHISPAHKDTSDERIDQLLGRSPGCCRLSLFLEIGKFFGCVRLFSGMPFSLSLR